jgi:hypothetical protein
MDGNPKPTFWQSLWACIVQLVLIVPITLIFTLAFFMLSKPIIKWMMTLLPILGEDGLQLLASILTVMIFGGFYFLSQSNWLVSLRNAFVSKMPEISPKVISYILFMLYLIPAGILSILALVFLGVVNGFKTRFDWVYYGILLIGLFLTVFLIDKKKKQQK